MNGKTNMAISDKLPDELLRITKSQSELIGEQGIMNQFTINVRKQGSSKLTEFPFTQNI
jgi:hypothetical protein